MPRVPAAVTAVVVTHDGARWLPAWTQPSAARPARPKLCAADTGTTEAGTSLTS